MRLLVGGENTRGGSTTRLFFNPHDSVGTRPFGSQPTGYPPQLKRRPDGAQEVLVVLFEQKTEYTLPVSFDPHFGHAVFSCSFSKNPLRTSNLSPQFLHSYS